MKGWAVFLMIAMWITSGTSALVAQEAYDNDKKTVKVQKRTLMERFEPEMSGTLEERIALKKKHLAERRQTKALLDTLDISERKRQKLLRDLKTSPFSDRLTKTMANAKFEEEE